MAQQELRINQHIGQYLTQQQLQFVRLLELNAPELDEAVERELEANPALEAADAEAQREREGGEATPWYLRKARNTSADDPVYDFSPRDDSESLGDVLERQVAERELPEDVAAMARYIIGNLDSNGYLSRSLPQMLNDLAFNHDVDVSEEVGEQALKIVRELEPAGVGAESLQECLLLQLRRMPASQRRDDAIEILENQFEAFHKRHSHKIISALKMSKERVDAANTLIRSLNPKPGAGFGGAESTAAGVIIPDFIISADDGDFSIALNNRIPELAIEESFSEAMRGMENRRGRPRKGTEFVTSRYAEARDFIKVLRQRQQTMLTVMTAILHWQRGYFESGDVYAMRPMMLKDLSKLTGLDPSVISRATANKYVATPWGAVMPLRAFFSDNVAGRSGSGSSAKQSAVADDESAVAEDIPAAGAADSLGAESGSDVLTNRKIEAVIAELVDAEDKRHPLSDEKIRRELLQRGYDISRRTIAKYRDRQGILVARLRKEF